MNTHDIELPDPAGHLFEWVDECGKRKAYYTEDQVVAAIEADRKQQGEVVVTKDESGYIIAVTRQDDEGRILSVIAEAASPADDPVTELSVMDAIQRLPRYNFGFVYDEWEIGPQLVAIRHDNGRFLRINDVTAAIDAAPQSQDREDAERYRFIRANVYASNPFGRGSWQFHYDSLPKPLDNPMKGVVAQNFDEAIDHARRVEGSEE